MLQTGDLAPDFSLPDADMETCKLSRLRGRTVVLYFYPRDDTPSCTLEAIEFSDLEDAFAALPAVVIGISRDDCLTHAGFRDKHGLSITLLSDEDGRVCQRYGVLQQGAAPGAKAGMLRSTFIIDTTGRISYCQYGVDVKGHAHEILRRIQSLSTLK